MRKYLYLSLTPEALIASMLPPEEFGNYLAVGAKKRTRGQAIFFEVSISELPEEVSLEQLEQRCVPHEDGTPKRSVYLSIYRVLEKVPISALKELYLVTDDGRVLKLSKGEYVPEKEKSLHLYQQLCPVTPRIASGYSPSDFLKIVTDLSRPVSVPKLVFVELKLDALGEDPATGSVGNLPYPNIEHLRDCLIGLKENPTKATKTVIRFFQGELPFRTCKNGFFVGDAEQMCYFPFPAQKDLNEKYYAWWRSALTIGLR